MSSLVSRLRTVKRPLIPLGRSAKQWKQCQCLKNCTAAFQGIRDLEEKLQIEKLFTDRLMGSEGHRIVIRNGSGNSSRRSNFTWLEQIQKLTFICANTRSSLISFSFVVKKIGKRKGKDFPRDQMFLLLLQQRERNLFYFVVGQQHLKESVLGEKKVTSSHLWFMRRQYNVSISRCSEAYWKTKHVSENSWG